MDPVVFHCGSWWVSILTGGQVVDIEGTHLSIEDG